MVAVKETGVASEEYTFATFSENPFYYELNGKLVDMAEVQSREKIMDLACGTGGVTRLVLERLRGARNSVIICIDHSASALRQARESLKERKEAALLFVQSRVEQLTEAIKGKVDAVFYCNAIHYVPDKDELLRRIADVIKPGGVFAFNTSFYEGPLEPEAVAFYRKWMLKAMRVLKQDYGLSLQKSEKVESRKHLTADDYKALVERHGFKIKTQIVDAVKVPLQGWIDISKFKDFIEGSMPGVPLDKASAALIKAVKQTYEEMKITYVARNWLDVVAVRV
ncbi:MAG: class I SAM-dependent methyltransferase [Chloroflexi bacterium]|nr:class I SAM-dependent methyltransferase [Chloroflexota bacterium]